MMVTFEREPFGWVHPFYRRHHQRRCCRSQNQNPLADWMNLVTPALETVGTLSNMLQMVMEQPDMDEFLGAHNATANGNKSKENDKFELQVDVKQFSPNELDVKMVDDCIVIEGKHAEKEEGQSFISRHFIRRFTIPKDVKPETITCKLSSDGMLSVTAPRNIEQKKITEKPIPINVTGQPAAAQTSEEKKDKETEKGPGA